MPPGGSLESCPDAIFVLRSISDSDADETWAGRMMVASFDRQAEPTFLLEFTFENPPVRGLLGNQLVGRATV